MNSIKWLNLLDDEYNYGRQGTAYLEHGRVATADGYRMHITDVPHRDISPDEIHVYAKSLIIGLLLTRKGRFLTQNGQFWAEKTAEIAKKNGLKVVKKTAKNDLYPGEKDRISAENGKIWCLIQEPDQTHVSGRLDDHENVQKTAYAIFGKMVKTTQPFKINAKYLMDALKGMNGEMDKVFIWAKPNSPIVLADGEGQIAIVMGMYTTEQYRDYPDWSFLPFFEGFEDELNRHADTILDCFLADEPSEPQTQLREWAEAVGCDLSRLNPDNLPVLAEKTIENEWYKTHYHLVRHYVDV